MSAPSPASRTLILLRHAKSAWPDVPDHDRPLAPRGQRDAPAIGRWLRDGAPPPDQVLCSSARRTRETWELVREQLGIDPPVSFDERVYGATPGTLLDLVRRTEAARRTLLVIGHNPTMSELALMLPAENEADDATVERMRRKFPTAAVAVVTFTGSWQQLRPGAGRLAGHVTPRDLRADKEGGSR
jgi:phosphohistidine phosphatase